MTVRHHVIITGIGRCGTTLLVALLTRLGLDTGFNERDIAKVRNAMARAGLEKDIRDDGCPYIVKNPWFCDYAEEIIARDDICIDHVFIPIRAVSSAAASRRHVMAANIAQLPLTARLLHRFRPRRFTGGLWHTRSMQQGDQEDILLRQSYKLNLALAEAESPVTFLQYPRITQDCDYLYARLRPILGETSLPGFRDVYERTVRPELVNSFSRTAS